MDNHENHSSKPNEGRDAEHSKIVCSCCFDLNAALIDPDSDDVKLDQNEFVLSIRRNDAQLRRAAASGCESCAIMIRALEYYSLIPSESSPVTLDAPKYPNLTGKSNDESVRLKLRLPISQGNPEISLNGPGLPQRFLQFYTDEAQRRSWKTIMPMLDICDDSLSSQGLVFINECLRLCQEHHTHCNQDDLSMPTRVLDIGTSGDGYVRLTETKHIKAEKYTALSYCWGRDPSIKTLTGNLEDFKSGIALQKLPAAYVDAIALTRQLDMRYIWIDALCIIQDSKRDWEIECSRMADTYTNAYITIGASSSSAVTKHFLKPQLLPPPQTSHRKRGVFTAVLLGSRGKEQVSVKARLMHATGAHWLWQDTRNDEQPLMEPLTQRGWTLQEKVLSTRFLSISSMEMVWTCKEQIFCECGSRLNHQREFGRTPLSQISQRDEAFNFWHKIVENYSKRKLTKSDDRLPAISAIAAIVQNKIGSKYVAGLWADNIELDLLWRRAEPTRVHAASSCYIAPSFSWASITGEIDYMCFRNGKWPYEKATMAIKATSETGPDAPLGRVTKSKLVLHGPMVMGYVERKDSHGWLIVRIGNAHMSFRPDTTLSTLIAGNGSEMSVCRRTGEQDREDLGHALDPKRVYESGSESKKIKIHCWMLRLGSYSVGRRGEKEHEWLVLGRSGTETGCFERVGWGLVKNHDEEQVLAQERPETITLV